MSDGGKGDKQRQASVSRDKFESNWDAIFKKKFVIGGDGDYIEPITQEKIDEFHKALEPYEI